MLSPRQIILKRCFLGTVLDQLFEALAKIEMRGFSLNLQSPRIQQIFSMQTQRERCQEEIKRELSKKTKKETMIPLARLLGLTNIDKLKRDECATFLAYNIALRLDALRNCQLSPLERMRALIDKLAACQDSSTAGVVLELKEILAKVYKIEQARGYQKASLPNNMENLKDSRSCICKVACSQPIRLSQAVCVYCKSYFHKECFKITTDTFECPYCSLWLLDPLDQVIECYYVSYFSPVCNRSLKFETKSKLASNEALQIRCVRVDGQNHSIQTWPDAGSLSFNGQIISEFKPLQTQASNKKRADFPSTVYNLREKNTLALIFQGQSYCLKSYRVSFGPHVLGIFRVKRLTINQLYEKIKTKILKHEESMEILNKSLIAGEGQDVEMPGIKISLKCLYSCTKIEIPIRGRFCKHFTCLDLKNTILMNCKIKKWTCPICNEHITTMLVDPILLDIITTIPEAAAVYFPKNGERQIFSEPKEKDPNEQQSELMQRRPNKKTKFESIDLDMNEQSMSNNTNKHPEGLKSIPEPVLNEEQFPNNKDLPVHRVPQIPSSIPQNTVEQQDELVWLEQKPKQFEANNNAKRCQPKNISQESEHKRKQLSKKQKKKENQKKDQPNKQLDQLNQKPDVLVISSDQEVEKVINEIKLNEQRNQLNFIKTMAPKRFNTEDILTEAQVTRIESKAYQALRMVREVSS